jgi:hypothetical protein
VGILLGSAVGGSVSRSATIGLYSTPDCSSCSLAIAPGGVGTFYVRVQPDGLPWPSASFTGASFKVEGLPAGWSALAVPSPSAIVTIGDPLGPVGAQIAFPFEVAGACVLLYTVTLTAPASGGPLGCS